MRSVLILISFATIWTWQNNTLCCAEDILCSKGDGKTKCWNVRSEQDKFNDSIKLQQEGERAADDIVRRHPEFSSNPQLLNKMLEVRMHFEEQGNTIGQSLALAEKEMIRRGELVDHEAVASRRLAEERMMIERSIAEEKRLLDNERKRIESEQKILNQQQEEIARSERRRNESNNSIEGGSTGSAAGGRIDVQTGHFHQRTAGGYVDTSTGTFHVDAAGGTINTKTGHFSPSN